MIAVMITITPAVAPISLEQLRYLTMRNPSLSIIHYRITQYQFVPIQYIIIVRLHGNLPTVTLTSSLDKSSDSE